MWPVAESVPTTSAWPNRRFPSASNSLAEPQPPSVHDSMPHHGIATIPRENDLALNCGRGARHAVPTTATGPSGSAFTIKIGPLFLIGTTGAVPSANPREFAL